MSRWMDLTKRMTMLFTAAAVAFLSTVLPVAAQPNSLSGLDASLQALARTVQPAVVQVLVSGYAPARGAVTSTESLLAPEHGSGSGVVVSADGYIVTNAHVVDGARRIRVQLPQRDPVNAQQSILKRRGRVLGAQLVNLDRETDLAVLKVGETGLHYLEFGDSDALKQGQLVMAFGSPLGLDNSVSIGVVSSVVRQLEPEDPMVYVQTDAPINPGSSGGPLVDVNGKVVGINTLIFTQSGGNEGIGFAAPSNIVRTIFESIRDRGRVRRGEIGVYPQTITPTLAAALGLKRDWGVVLGDVTPGGPANRAGLEAGDVVLAMNGKTMENGRQFRVNVYPKAVGSGVDLLVLRGADTLRVAVTVTEREDEFTQFADLVTPDKNLVSELGILGIDMDRQIAQMFPRIRNRTGVVVAARAPGPDFFSSGFLPGDIIHEVNRTPVKSLADLRGALARLKAFDPVAVQVERDGRMRYVVFELQK